MAIDSSKVEAYEKSKPRKYLSLDGSSADWGVKQNTDGNNIAWLGYKLHIAADTKSELPLALEVTSSSVHNSTDIYKSVKYDHKPQAIIPLNLRGAQEPKAGFDFDGTPMGSAGYRMVFWAIVKMPISSGTRM